MRAHVINSIKSLTIVDQYASHVGVGFEHFGNMMGKIDEGSCCGTSWSVGVLIFRRFYWYGRYEVFTDNKFFCQPREDRSNRNGS